MIEIEVIKATNPDLIGKRVFYKNSMSIGGVQQDFYIDLTTQYQLEVIDDKLNFNNKSNKYLLNGKIAKSSRFLKLNDTITIGEVEFKIIQFAQEKEFNLRNTLNTETEKIIKENPKALEVLKFLKSKL